MAFEIGDQVLFIPHSYSDKTLAFSTKTTVIKKHKNGNVVTDHDKQIFSQGGFATGNYYTSPHIELATEDLLNKRRTEIIFVRSQRKVKECLDKLGKRTDYIYLYEVLKKANLL